MLILFASCIFDLPSVGTSPILFKCTGGCGGTPPWGNVITAVMLTCRVRGGRSLPAVASIVRESNLRFDEKISPNETIFLQSVHSAQINPRGFAAFVDLVKTAASQGIPKQEILDRRNECLNVGLPAEVLTRGMVIHPENVLMAGLIGNLHRMIQTDLDLVVELAAAKRVAVLNGEQPVRVAFERIDAELLQFSMHKLDAISEFFNEEEITVSCTRIACRM
eukprot:3684579-Amphidinium_carterae.1